MNHSDKIKVMDDLIFQLNMNDAKRRKSRNMTAVKEIRAIRDNYAKAKMTQQLREWHKPEEHYSLNQIKEEDNLFSEIDGTLEFTKVFCLTLVVVTVVLCIAFIKVMGA